MYIKGCMSYLKALILFITLSLAAIDQWTGGVVSKALIDTWENNTVMVEDFTCWLGYLIYIPTMEVYGIAVPAPSLVSVFVAITLATVLMFAIEFYGAVKIPFLYKLLIIVGVWAVIKALAYSMMLSVDGCTTWAADKYGPTNTIYDAGSLIGSVAIFFKYVLRK